MAKEKRPMKGKLALTKASVDEATSSTLEHWAELEGRSVQAHNGVLLRRIASLYQTDRQKLISLGLMTPLALDAS